MAIIELSTGDQTYDQSPTLNLRVNAVLPGNARIDVRRNGQVVGTAVQTGSLTYAFTDNAPIGAAVYTAELVLVNQAPLISAAFTVNIVGFPAPTLVNVTDTLSNVIASGGTTDQHTLHVNLSVSAPLLPGVFVDVYRNGVVLGQATQLTPTTFRYIEANVVDGVYEYKAKLRYAAFNPETLPYDVTIESVVIPVLGLTATEIVPSTGYQMSARCNPGRSFPSADSFLIDIAIDASLPSGTFFVMDSLGNELFFDEENWPGIEHVQGVTTVRMIDTLGQSWNGSIAPSLFGTTLSLYWLEGDQTVATANVPISCAPIAPPPPTEA